MKQSKYLNILYSKFDTTEEIVTELINLETILNLPKGTELYISDIHGEYDAFLHILKTGAGNVKEKIYDTFKNTKTENERNDLTLLVAYPKQILKRIELQLNSRQLKDWYYTTILDLLKLIKFCSSKYSRSKLRKALPQEYAYTIEELLYLDTNSRNKNDYYQKIISKLISLQIVQPFIIGLGNSIQRLVIDHLHVVGDIFDRGLHADKVMDTLLTYHSIDIQWGNHDILWLGGYAGSKACLITLLRIATRYNYLYDLEKSYGINLRPLFIFSDTNYNSNSAFCPHSKNKNFQHENDLLLEKVHQALTIIQFKLEGQIIKRRPDFDMSDRLLLQKINYQENIIKINNTWHSLNNSCFQTIDLNTPYLLNEEEQYVVDTLLSSFQKSEKLQRHMQFLLDKGSMYSVYNNHLLFHGCIPLTKDGDFLSMKLENKEFKGKALLDQFEYYIRKGCQNKKMNTDYYTDIIWYSWTGKKSPLFGRHNMTTFERYFINDKTLHIEEKNPYYYLREDPNICHKILHAFKLNDKNSKIINGHTSIKVKAGETPLKANGKLIVIDGGLAKAYQETTGIAGYTLLNNSYGFQLVTHHPFESIDKLLDTRYDKTVIKKVIDKELKRLLIKDTSIGKQIIEQCRDLENLLKYIKDEIPN
ncbi:MAG: fructose-1,6-bisphosphatase [Coprobacillaceae bacterium]